MTPDEMLTDELRQELDRIDRMLAPLSGATMMHRNAIAHELRSRDRIDPHDLRYSDNDGDETTALLRATLAKALQPPVAPRAASFWSEVLADHVRNQHRKRVGAELFIDRWDRSAPEVKR